MSDPLRIALREMDVEIGTLEARLATLRPEREALAVYLGEPARPSLVGATAGAAAGQRRVADVAAGTPIGASPSSGVGHLRGVTMSQKQRDGAERILAALRSAHGPLRYPDLARASKFGIDGAKRAVAALVAAGAIVRTGKTTATRYTLPGQPIGAPADTEGDRGARRAAHGR
jgi:hypothetical protein